MANETSSEHALASHAAIAVMATVYFSVFVTSELGNGFVIFSLLVRKRRTRTAMDDFVFSLATTDFLFTTLTLFNGAEYILDEWKLGVIACKIQGLLLEVTYAASALTLATISYSRYRAANTKNPFIFLRVKPKTKRNSVLIWLSSFVFSLPLLYGYTVMWSGGSLICTNANFNEVTRQAYYLAQAVLLFVIPITVMLVSQRKTTSSLRSHFQKQPSDVTPANIRRRAVVAERRITKLLKWTWIIFMCCCAPFITYRTLDYFMHIRKRGHVCNQLWYLGQMLIVLNAAINPFLYHRITKNGVGDRTKARCVERCCCCCLRHGGRNHVVSTLTNQEKIEIKVKTRRGIPS